GQRPRERLIELGEDSLSNSELLAIILGSGHGQLSAIELAQKLLREFEGFRGLDRRTINELCKIAGIGAAKAAQIKAALAIGRKLAAENDVIRDWIETSDDAFRRVALRIRDLTREVFVVIFLTCRNRVIRDRILFEGSLTDAVVNPREIIKAALDESAASLIFVHNHPSHDPYPSPDDRLITKKLKEACNVVGIGVNDHIIVGGERYFSFADEGLL
ncbi:MAG: DNA repair protein RadC, partial [Anaerolineae bacterium]|nr:DNA repair protein RadC [Anaerolineae bacterium]